MRYMARMLSSREHVCCQATVEECDIHEGDFLRVDEKHSAEYEARMKALKAADSEKKQRQMRLAKLINDAEDYSPNRCIRACISLSA